MLELLEYTFIQNALIVGFLASIIFGLVGTLVVVKRIVFISGGIAHASFGGVGMAFFLGWDPLVGALIFAVGSAISIGYIGRESVQREDTTIGIIWAVGMALGALFYYLTPGYLPSAESFLFGNILMIRSVDVTLLAILTVITVLIITVFFRRFQAVSFDEEFSEIVGINTNLIYYLLLLIVSISIVLLLKFVGIILVIAMLSIPPTIAGLLTYNLKHMMVYSTIFSLIFTYLGLSISYALDIPSGPTIVTFAGIVFIGALIGNKIGERLSETS
ncbi:ABC-type Mn2+/Zn2+ transport system permease component [Methanonatronarchaeum thermophilum]|uniref:ABC-type Mn2+/Zn2+ transport system permease component n=1 Tax=Methanonatronarchaeum thermophilum TaxID=1927129 RepID=A0A1Y3GIG2_9EURY|nr:metal ABC transporter permease [Methanonatronarchaeum thermophilum]OUJ19225.1 ABC-type Mn2+/Zn2+ transport system permease component [Methanonatronarchaeum thermophilum]